MPELDPDEVEITRIVRDRGEQTGTTETGRRTYEVVEREEVITRVATHAYEVRHESGFTRLDADRRPAREYSFERVNLIVVEPNGNYQVFDMEDIESYACGENVSTEAPEDE